MTPASPSSGSGMFWHVFPRWFLALYRRPLAFLIGALVIPLLAVCLWLYAENERQWRAHEAHHLLVAARMASRLIEDELARTRQAEDAIASQPWFVSAVKRNDPAMLAGSLQVLVNGMPSVERALVTDAAGRRLAEAAAAFSHQTSPETAAEAPEALDRPVSEVYVGDRVSGEKAVSVSYPIRDGHALLGALHARYGLDAISNWIGKVRVEPAGFLYVADHRGRLVAYPFQLLSGTPKDVSDWPAVAARASAQGELVRFQQGRPLRAWTAAVVLLEPYGWKVIAQQPDAEMLAPFRQLVGSFVILIAALAGVISLLVLRWGYLHRATLRLVEQQAEQLQAGHRRNVVTKMRGSP